MKESEFKARLQHPT